MRDNTGDLMMDEEQAVEEKASSAMETDAGESKEDYLERLKREATKKELKPVHYTAADLQSFRKNFYIESKEIASMSEIDIKMIRENLGEIAVKGIDIPRPIKQWYQAGLSDKILKILEKKKYDKPFPIQCQSLPVIMSGRDTIGKQAYLNLIPHLTHVLDIRRHRWDRQWKDSCIHSPYDPTHCRSTRTWRRWWTDRTHPRTDKGVSDIDLHGSSPVLEAVQLRDRSGVRRYRYQRTADWTKERMWDYCLHTWTTIRCVDDIKREDY